MCAAYVEQRSREVSKLSDDGAIVGQVGALFAHQQEPSECGDGGDGGGRREERKGVRGAIDLVVDAREASGDGGGPRDPRPSAKHQIQRDTHAPVVLALIQALEARRGRVGLDIAFRRDGGVAHGGSQKS